MYRKLAPALLLSALTLVPAAARAADDPVLTTFLEAKAQYKARRWDGAESALRRLGELLAAPEHAAVRPKVLPAFYFYGAAVAYERRDEERAKESLREYFGLVPNASLDKGAYPKAFSIFFDAEKTRFDEATKGSAPGPGPQSTGGGVLPDYASFVPDPAAIPMNDGAASWVESPVRFLLTDDDKKRYRSLGSDEARREFVSAFWKRVDPRPETPDNELQTEFYRRVQYADARFSSESSRGALTDRGMVFVIMGPPSYAARAILKQSEDVMTTLSNASNTSSVRLGGAATITVQNDPAYAPNDMDGEAESWYYRSDRLPKGIPFNEIVFQFVTRKGYGLHVLQKEPRQLTTLAKVQQMLREGRAN